MPKRRTRSSASRSPAATGLDALIAIGPARRPACATRRWRQDCRQTASSSPPSTTTAGERAARGVLRAGDLVLLKGSRGAALESVLRAPRAAGDRRDALLSCSTPCTVTGRRFNVFKYITFRTLVAGLMALTLSLLLGPIAHPAAHRRCRSASRSATTGPPAHAKKAGTPTMGGMLILFSPRCSRRCCWPTSSNPYVWLALGVTLAHGLIGFFDDWAKVRRRNSRGLPGRASALARELGDRRARGRRRSTSGRTTAATITMPFLKNVRPDLGLLVHPVRRRS